MKLPFPRLIILIHVSDSLLPLSQAYPRNLIVANMPGTISTVTTEVPGPKSKVLAKQLDYLFDARTVHFVADYVKSSGN